MTIEDVRRNRARDKVFEAMEYCIEAGMSPAEVKKETAEAWAEACRRLAQEGIKVLV